MRKSKITKLITAVSALALAVAMSVGMVSAATAETSVTFTHNVSKARGVQKSAHCIKTSADSVYAVKLTAYSNYTEVPRLRVRAWNVDKAAKASVFYPVTGVKNYNFDYNTTPKKGAICRLDGDISANATQNGGYMKGTFIP